MHRLPISHLLLFLSVLFFLIAAFHLITRFLPQNLAFAKLPPQVSSKELVLPTVLRLPFLGKTFSVIPTVITNGKWETTTKGVSYLSTSSLPGEKGNAIFYGHNFPSLLGGIDTLPLGSKISITESDGSESIYAVTEKKIVDPTDTSILSLTTESRLTLYTCYGFLDSKRYVVIAHLLE